MEINKNMTRAEQIGHVYEYTSKYAIYIGSRVKNEADFVELKKHIWKLMKEQLICGMIIVLNIG